VVTGVNEGVNQWVNEVLDAGTPILPSLPDIYSNEISLCADLPATFVCSMPEGHRKLSFFLKMGEGGRRPDEGGFFTLTPVLKKGGVHDKH